uniref:GNAT family N-acetyltransferase n=1 Tax=Clavibacter michiganensis TaxID=28447 RepID=UPI00374E0D59
NHPGEVEFPARARVRYARMLDAQRLRPGGGNPARPQGSGAAAECAAAMVAWLREDGVGIVRANIHPDHAASEAVARRLGLAPTDERVDGEVRWESRAG